MAINFPPASSSPWTDPNGQVWIHDGDGWIAEEGQQEGQMTGFKNVLINGDFRINQRNFNGDWEATSSNQYGYDRWVKQGGSTMAQKIEPQNLIVGETYTGSWLGDQAATIRQEDDTVIATGPSPLTFTMPAITGAWIKTDFFFSTASQMQLELGTEQTNFEVRNIQIELAMCQRYYWKLNTLPWRMFSTQNTHHRTGDVWFPTTMRIVPTLTYTVSSGTLVPPVVSENFASLTADAATTTDAIAITSFSVDAEMP